MTSAVKPNLALSDFFSRSIALYAENVVIFVLFSLAGMTPLVLKFFLDSSMNSGLVFIGALLGPVVVCCHMFFLMGLMYAIASRASREYLTFSDIVAYVWPRFWRGLGGYILFGIAVLGGMILLIIPGVYCLTVFYFFIFPILLEDKGIWAAFKRSDELVRGRFWNVLGAHALLVLVLFLVLIPVVLGLKMMGLSDFLANLAVFFLSALTLPVFSAFYFNIYSALKIEKDGVINISVHSS